jgi:hypothetical protein
MNSKRHKENNQLSLTLDLPTQAIEASRPIIPQAQTKWAGVVPFPIRQPQVASFRERVMQDLMRTRVMVAE